MYEFFIRLINVFMKAEYEYSQEYYWHRQHETFV